jgi:hypothetical protein
MTTANGHGQPVAVIAVNAHAITPQTAEVIRAQVTKALGGLPVVVIGLDPAGLALVLTADAEAQAGLDDQLLPRLVRATAGGPCTVTREFTEAGGWAFNFAPGPRASGAGP